MAQWPGLGERIRQRLVELGYKQANGKPDVLGFSLKHSYIPMYVYKWANAGVMPSQENVERLARDLNVSAPWLLFGGEVDKAPAAPRKRGRALRCLVAAPLLVGIATTTAGVPPLQRGHDAPRDSVATSDNVRGITSRRRRRIAIYRRPHYFSPQRECQVLRQLTCRAA